MRCAILLQFSVRFFSRIFVLSLLFVSASFSLPFGGALVRSNPLKRLSSHLSCAACVLGSITYGRFVSSALVAHIVGNQIIGLTGPIRVVTLAAESTAQMHFP